MDYSLGALLVFWIRCANVLQFLSKIYNYIFFENESVYLCYAFQILYQFGCVRFALFFHLWCFFTTDRKHLIAIFELRSYASVVKLQLISISLLCFSLYISLDVRQHLNDEWNETINFSGNRHWKTQHSCHVKAAFS